MSTIITVEGDTDVPILAQAIEDAGYTVDA
jgi:hypothetical protein